MPHIVDDVTIHGYVTASLVNRRGKVVKRVSDHNIWTLIGREYQLKTMAKATAPATDAIRNDLIAYVGVGSGVTVVSTQVTELVSPLPVNVGADMLVAVGDPIFVPTPTQYYMRYLAEFDYADLSMDGSVTITEYALYTNGHPLYTDWNPGDRPITGVDATTYPVAYTCLDSITKTDSVKLIVQWELRA